MCLTDMILQLLCFSSSSQSNPHIIGSNWLFPLLPESLSRTCFGKGTKGWWKKCSANKLI